METNLTYRIECNLIQILDEINTVINKKLYSSNENEITDGYCNYSDGILELIFNVELTYEQIEEVNSVVTSHIINTNYADLLKFKINNSFRTPEKIDYDILGLKKDRTIIKGELREVGYYNNYVQSSSTYSDLVVKEFRDYTRDALGIVQYRIQTSNWILNDNTTGLTLTFIKHYSPEEAIQEGIERRNNMISFAKTTLLSNLKNIYGEPANQSYAFDLLLSVKTQMDYFSQGYTQPLRDAISASTKGYLTEQIKINIINELTL